MVQESIVEYINAQMKLGVSRDTIKTTLTGAGWVAADVEDTLKKIEVAKMAQPVSAVSTVPAMSTASVAAKPTTPTVSPKPVVFSAGASVASPAAQTIKVSDLVSLASSAQAKPATTSASPVAKSPLTGPSMIATTPAGAKSSNTFQAPASSVGTPHGSRGALITDIVLVVIIIAVGAFAGFLYMQNNGLNAQLSALNGQSSGVNSQLSTLQTEVAASTTALTAQVSTLTAQTQELQTELAFYAAPAGTVAGSTSTVTVNGVVSGGGKTPYIITATYGAKIFVANFKAANVIAALAPLMGTAATTKTTTSTSTSTTSTVVTVPATAPRAAQFSGIYVPGSDSITLTAVNGTSL